MIVCPRCSKENQDHYKFCLGCGAELPRDAEQPKSFSAPTPPSGTPMHAGPPPVVAPPPPIAAPAPPPASAPGMPRPPMGAPPPVGPPPAAPSFGGPPPAVAPPMAPPAPMPMGAPAPMPMAPPAPMAPPMPMAPPAPMAPPMPMAPPAAAPPVGPPMGARPPVAPAAAPPPAAGKINCPKCGSANNPGFKFCGTCGHPLADVAHAPAPVMAPVAAAPGGGGSGTLVLIRPDGTEGDTIPFMHGKAVGREATPQFANDSYLSPRHATFLFEGSGLRVKDEGSLNGIYLRIDREDPVELHDGQIFRVGQEIIRFERISPRAPGPDGVQPMGSPGDGLIGRICLVTGRATTGNCYAIPADGLHLGRERGDILFPDDGYVSGLHARIHAEGDKVFLTDVGSSNGTFLRVQGSGMVASGGMILLGQQLFRVEY